MNLKEIEDYLSKWDDFYGYKRLIVSQSQQKLNFESIRSNGWKIVVKNKLFSAEEFKVQKQKVVSKDTIKESFNEFIRLNSLNEIEKEGIELLNQVLNED